MIWAPETGFRSNVPKRVTFTLDLEVSVEKVGRSLDIVSPFVSTPVVILNGEPELAKMSGLNVTCHGRLILPKMKALWRTSNDDRPNSLLKS